MSLHTTSKPKNNSKRSDPTVLWNPVTFETTNQISFTDKSNVIKDRKLYKSDYADQLWYLGYDDINVMYRRKRLLAPLSIETRKDIEGPPANSTHRRDYDADGFVSVKTPRTQGQPAGLITKNGNQGLQYGSEDFNKLTINLREENKRQLGIFSAREEYKLSGIQQFRDEMRLERNPVEKDQAIIQKSIHGGLTIPIAGL